MDLLIQQLNFRAQNKQFRLRQAFKVALACLIDALIVLYFKLPLSFLCVLGSYIVMTVFVDQTIIKGLERIIGPAIAVILAAFILNIFYASLFTLIVATFVILLIGSYCFYLEKFPYAALLGCIVASLVIYLGYSSPTDGITTGKFFVINTAIGVIVAWLVTWLIWPVKPERDLMPTLSAVVLCVGDRLLKSEKEIETNKAIAFALKCLNLSKDVITQEELQCTKNLLQALKILDLKVQKLAKKFVNIQSHNLSTQLQAPLDELKLNLIQQFSFLAAGINNNSVFDFSSMNNALIAFEENLNKAREEKLFLQYNIKIALQVLAFYSECKEINNLLKKACSDFTEKKIPSTKAPEHHEEELASIDLWKRSIKFAVTITLFFVITNYFSFMGGVQAIITAVVIAAQPNLGRGDHRSRLRIYGVLLGGLVGIIFLAITLHLQSYFIYLVLLFLGILFFDYFSLGDESYAYAALQAGIVLPLILMVTFGPDNNLSIALQRVLGVLTGVCVAYLISRFIWPVNPIKELDHKINSFLKMSAQYIEVDILKENTLEAVQEKLNAFDFGKVLFDVQQLFGAKTTTKFFEHVVSYLMELQREIITLKQYWQDLVVALPESMHTELSNTLQQLSNEILSIAMTKKDTVSRNDLFINYLVLLNQFRHEHITETFNLNVLQKYAAFTSCLYSCILSTHKLKRLAFIQDEFI